MLQFEQRNNISISLVVRYHRSRSDIEWILVSENLERTTQFPVPSSFFKDFQTQLFVQFFFRSPFFNVHYSQCCVVLNRSQFSVRCSVTWGRISFKNGLSKICGRQPLKNLKSYGLLISVQIFLRLYFANFYFLTS